MRESKDCNLIKDLLPTYIDGLTSVETNEFIQNHLQQCKKCKELYENMNANLNEKENSEDQKKIRILKKINHKIRTLQAIIILILIIFLIIIFRKYLILNHIENIAENTNYNNYYEKIVETTEKVISRTDYYQNGDNFISIHTKINTDDEVEKYVEYKLNDKEDYISEINGEKMRYEGKELIKPLGQYQFLNKSFLGNIGLALVPGSLEEMTLYRKDCYLLKVENYFNFIDKETGLTIKEININNNSVINYEYEFNSVTDSKILELINEHTK